MSVTAPPVSHCRLRVVSFTDDKKQNDSYPTPAGGLSLSRARERCGCALLADLARPILFAIGRDAELSDAGEARRRCVGNVSVVSYRENVHAFR